MQDRDILCTSFINQSAWANAQQIALPGDASSRRYIRLIDGEKKALLMDVPQDSDGGECKEEASPEERKSAGYNACARLAGANIKRFTDIANALRANGIHAPEIFDIDTINGFAIIEDLGADVFAQSIRGGVSEALLYEAAIDVLLKIATLDRQQFSDLGLLTYDNIAMEAEVALLTQWYWPHKKGAALASALEDEYQQIWRSILSQIGNPSTLVLRDYHAENLLWMDAATDDNATDNAARGIERVGVIDFQDALIGSPVYDLVSLLEDARRDVPVDLAQRMKKRYFDRVQITSDLVDLDAEYAILGAQRNAKILGIFARLANRDGKLRYLDLVPRVEGHFRRNLDHPILLPVRQFLVKHIPELEL